MHLGGNHRWVPLSFENNNNNKKRYRAHETSRPIAIKNSTDLSSLTARLRSSGDVTTP